MAKSEERPKQTNGAVYRLLALGARAECRATHHDQLAQQAAQLTEREWSSVPAQAEIHGMGPLLYTHLKAAAVEPPLSVRRKLQGLYLRHRELNRVRMGVLREVLSVYDAAGIRALVLKGAALAHLVYPEPGLRPMSDLDILVPAADLWRAQSLLSELGFDAPLPFDQTLPHRHLVAATLETEGLPVHVEIHHRLLSDYFDSAIAQLRAATGIKVRSVRDASAAKELDGPTVPLYPFALAGLTAYTLGHEDTLWYLCQHLVSHVNVWESGRLIWVADIVSFAERFSPEVDWEQIRRQHPAVLDTLSLLHFMTPLSEELSSRAGVEIGRAPKGIGVEYGGWPRTGTMDRREREYGSVLRATLVPSEWWLRLRYSLGSARHLFWYRWVRHPLYILGHVVRVCLEKLGWPTPLELVRGNTPR
jgi:hypothetical protein